MIALCSSSVKYLVVNLLENLYVLALLQHTPKNIGFRNLKELYLYITYYIGMNCIFPYSHWYTLFP